MKNNRLNHTNSGRRMRRLMAFALALMMLLSANLPALAEAVVATVQAGPTQPADGGKGADPSAKPTATPVAEPSEEPSGETDGEPAGDPTDGPEEKSSKEPTAEPSTEPSKEPSEAPSEKPSGEPTEAPTAEPEEGPAGEPTAEPTEGPEEAPTEEPTETVTEEPTAEPTEGVAEEPTGEPTAEPTEGVAEEPTGEPTAEPTEGVTEEPTEEPTAEPTEEPEESPTEEPAADPTEEPTEAPTEEPTPEPTEEPVAPLSVTGLTASEDEVFPGEVIEFTFECEDCDSVRWHAYADDEEVASGKARENAFTWTPVAAGVYTVVVVARRGEETAEASVEVTVREDYSDVKVTFTAVDENGNVIDGLRDVAIEKGEYDLAADAPASPRGYDYVKTTLNGKTVSALRYSEADRAWFAEVRGKERALTDDTALEARFAENFTKERYTYSDANLYVVATLDYADAVPDSARFRATQVSAGTSGYNYNAYMDALNRASDQEYTAENTLLYDFAFMVERKDEDGLPTGEWYEYQPEHGAVKLHITFRRNQISDRLGAEDAGDVEIIHLPLDQDVRDAVDSTAEATRITAGDINIERVSDSRSDVNLDGSVDNVTIKLDGLSVVAVTVTVAEASQEYILQFANQAGEPISGTVNGNYYVRGSFNAYYASWWNYYDYYAVWPISNLGDSRTILLSEFKVPWGGQYSGDDADLSVTYDIINATSNSVSADNCSSYLALETDAKIGEYTLKGIACDNDSHIVTVILEENASTQVEYTLQFADQTGAAISGNVSGLYYVRGKFNAYYSGWTSNQDYYNIWQISDLSATYTVNLSEFKVPYANPGYYTGEENVSVSYDVIKGDQNSLTQDSCRDAAALGSGAVIGAYTLIGITRDDENHTVTVQLNQSAPTPAEYTIKPATITGDALTGTYYVLADLVANNNHYYALTPVETLNDTPLSEFTGYNGSYTYTGNEPVALTLIRQVGSNAITWMDAVNGTKCLVYTDGFITENHIVSIAQDNANGIGAVTLTALGTPTGQAHTATVEFRDGESNLIAPVPELEQTYYLLATLTDKQNSGRMMAYAVVPVGTDAYTGVKTEGDGLGKLVISIPENAPFSLLDAKGKATGDTVAFDANRFTLGTQLYHKSGITAESSYSVALSGSDVVPGYKFEGNDVGENQTNSTIVMRQVYDNIYKLQVDFAPESPAITETDRLFLVAELTVSNTKRYCIKPLIVSAGETELSWTIGENDWVDGNGNTSSYDILGGENPLSPTLRVVRSNNSTLSATEYRNGNCTVIEEGGMVKACTVSYNPDPQRTTELLSSDGNRSANSIKIVTDHVLITKIDAKKEYDYASVLGDGKNFGITANYFDQRIHVESNFAVNQYKGNGSPGEPDLSNGPGVFFIANAIPSGNEDYATCLKWEGSGMSVLYWDTTSDQITRAVQNQSAMLTTVRMDGSTISANYVQPIINDGIGVSQALANHDPTFPVDTRGANAHLEINTLDFPEDATIYLDGDALTSWASAAEGLYFTKHQGQLIVINFKTSGSVTLNKFGVRYNTSSNFVSAGEAGSASAVDVYSRQFVWNMPSATAINLNGACAGMFLAPLSNSTMNVNTTSSGWIISAGTVYNGGGGEWHGVSQTIPQTSANFASLNLSKMVDGIAPDDSQVFKFKLEWLDDSREWQTVVNEKQNEAGSIAFENIPNLHGGWNVYRVTETGNASGTEDFYNRDSRAIYAAVKYGIKSGDYSLIILENPVYYIEDPEGNVLFDAANALATAENVNALMNNGQSAANPVMLTALDASDAPTFENTTKTTNLIIGKAVTGDPSPATDMFTFEITLTKKGNPVSGTFALSVTDEQDATIQFDTNGKATVSITQGQTATVSGVPLGLHYTVTETQINGQSFDGTAVVDGYTSEGVTQSGDIRTDAPKQIVTSNVYTTGSLAVSKTTNGNDCDTAKPFEFTVTLTNRVGKASETFGNTTFTDGVATFSLANGQSKTISGLPVGTAYTVTEADYSADGYVTTVGTVSGRTASGTITKAESTADYTNTRDTFGDIRLKKTVSGHNYDVNKGFEFTVTILDADGAVDTAFGGAYGDAEFTEGVANLTLKHNDVKIITQLPNGTRYVIAEADYSAEGYTPRTVTGSLTGTIVGGDDSVIEITVDNVRAATGSIALTAVKEILNRNFQEGDTWRFTLAAVDGAPMKDADGVAYAADKLTVENSGSGIAFPVLYYSLADLGGATSKTFEYTVTETGTVTGVTNDTENVKSVTVTVTDNGTNALSVTASNVETPTTFTNTYTATGSVKLEATKTVNGAVPDENETFSFTLAAVDNAPTKKADGAAYVEADLTVKNVGGAITFPALYYTLADVGKTYAYTVKETGTAPDGYTLDATAYTVTVEVKDEVRDGKLEITKTIQVGEETKDAITFANTYAATGSVELTATKTVNGAVPDENEAFSFTLAAVDNAPMKKSDGTAYEPTDLTVKNVGGAITFPALYYTLADVGKTYAYTVKETGTAPDGYTLDATAYTVTVEVKDEVRDDELEITKTIQVGEETKDAITFANTYAATGSVALTATKTVNGAVPQDGELFAFTLAAVDNAPMRKSDGTAYAETDLTVKNVGGAITFPALYYTLADVGKTYAYTVKETGTAPDGYTLDATAYTVTVEVKDEVRDGELEITKTIQVGEETKDAITFNNIHTEETTSVRVTKVWVDDNDADGKRPAEIKVQLKANDADSGAEVTLNAANGWTHTWTNLPRNADGQAITYTVDEVSVPANYTKAVTTDTETIAVDVAYRITNTITGTTKLSGKKTWDDNDDQDGIRPESVTIRLLADGKVTDRSVVATGPKWTYSFTDLPAYADGVKIAYTIAEDAVKGYTAKIDGNNVTNSHVPKTVDISGRKTWDDNDDQDGIRPERVTIRLLANGKATDRSVVATGPKWTYSFTDLPAYADGEKITYTIAEDAVEGYTAKVDGYNVTNSHAPETVDISGRKIWDDNDDQDGIRPERVTIRLLADGKATDRSAVVTGPSWTYSFTDLDKYADGKAIVYTVAEDAVTGYQARVDGYNITNVHAPTPNPVVSIPVSKIWDDDDDAHGVRPASISVQLLADGEEVATAELTADTGWAYTFTDLPELREDGEAIAYTVTETKVEYYETLISGTTITNRLEEKTPEAFTEIAGTKTWVDNDDAAGKRPGSITVQLLCDGEVYRELTVTSATGWRYTFSELPVDDGYGHEYVYEIHEPSIPGYVGVVVNGYDLKNTLLMGRGGEIKSPTTRKRLVQGRVTGTPLPRLRSKSDKELEQLFDMFGYNVPLWGMLMPTGDETPTWPWIFAGIGTVALALIPILGRKRKKRGT